jgi:hypothetical protein
VDSTVVLNNSGDDAAILFEEFSCPVSDSTKTLNTESAVFDTKWKSNFFTEIFVAG